MLASLQPASRTCASTQHRCNINSITHRPSLLRNKPRQSLLVVTAESGCQHSGNATGRPSLPSALGVLFATVLSASSIISAPALAKSTPVQKADPYEDLQKIISSRGGSSSGSLFENFKKSAAEAARAPAEILKAPAEVFKAPEPASPSPLLPITKAAPLPDKAKTASSGGSGGLLAAAGALVAAAGLAFNARRASPKTSAPSPNKIKAKVKSGAKSASKQAPKQPSSPFSFFGGKSGGTGKVKANQVGNTAKVKAGQVGRTAKIKAGAAKQNAQSAPKKAGLFGTGSSRPKEAAAKATGGLFGTGSTRPKQAAAKATGGLFGTGSTRPGTGSTRPGTGSTRPGTGSTRLGTGSTRPGTKSLSPGGTGKVKVPTPGQAASTAKRAANTGGSSLLGEDAGTTVGALGVVGLAVAVGGLVIFSLGGSGGGGGGSPTETSGKSLLDRVPEPLPVVQKAKQATTEVASKLQGIAPQTAPNLTPSPPSIPSPGDLTPSLPSPSPSPSQPPMVQKPQTPSGPDLVPELIQKPRTGTPLAPPLTDSNKPKAPSGPDLRPPSPGGLANSLGATPQLAKSAPKAADKAASKVSEATPQIAQAAKQPSGKTITVLISLVSLIIACVVVAYIADDTGPPASASKPKESPSPNGVSKAQSASSNGGPSPPDNPPSQTAEAAAADAKERAQEAREWIDEWKGKQ